MEMRQDEALPQRRTKHDRAARPSGRVSERLTIQLESEDGSVLRACQGFLDKARTLRDQERACLLLHYQGGFSDEELAELLSLMAAFGRKVWTASDISKLIAAACQNLAG